MKIKGTGFLKSLIWSIGVCSILTPIVGYFLMRFFHLPGPETYLPLSLFGIQQGLFWQFITYGFVSNPTTLFHLSFLVSLFVQLTLFHYSQIQVLKIYGFGKWLLSLTVSWVLLGAVGLFGIWVFDSPMLIHGIVPLIFMSMMIYILINPSWGLLQTFFGSFRIKHLMMIGMILYFIHEISQENYPLCLQLLAACGLGFLVKFFFDDQRKTPDYHEDDSIIDITPNLKK